ncbi:hypothetical protein [uncultured Sphingomonas sp.]|uniref:DUF3108 domain-containing protein n=1 Tax=uncultured Sphingomonas sp. TaxID=158754 RepID=UPI0035C9A242
MPLSLLVLLAAASSALPGFDGSKLRPGESCYAMTTMVDGKPVPAGAVLRRIERAPTAGRKAGSPWTVTIRSRYDAEAIAETLLTLDYRDLRPLTVRDGDVGKPRTELIYGPDRVTGTDYSGDTPQPVDVGIAPPLWDPAGLELLLTALPLAPGLHADIPVFSGTGKPTMVAVDVIGPQAVTTPDGPVQAWVVGKSWADGTPVNYFVATADRRLLGIDVGDVSSRLGGDCSALK